MTPVRILAIDYGAKRIGLAVSDPLGFTAQPLPFVKNAGWTPAIAELKKIAAEKSVQKVLMGLPRAPDGGEGAQGKTFREFAAKLGEALGLPVEFVDETMTSREANAILIEEMDVSREKRKKVVDSLAASLMLEAYLRKQSK